MKWVSVLLVAAFLQFMPFQKAEAGTNVYVSVGVGGACVVGGAFLAWGVSYSSRYLRGTPLNFPFSVGSSWEAGGYPPPLSGLSPTGSLPDRPGNLTVTLPLFTFRW